MYIHKVMAEKRNKAKQQEQTILTFYFNTVQTISKNQPG